MKLRNIKLILKHYDFLRDEVTLLAEKTGVQFYAAKWGGLKTSIEIPSKELKSMKPMPRTDHTYSSDKMTPQVIKLIELEEDQRCYSRMLEKADQILDALDPDLCEPIKRVYLEGEPMARVASDLGVTRQALYKSFNRALSEAARQVRIREAWHT